MKESVKFTSTIAIVAGGLIVFVMGILVPNTWNSRTGVHAQIEGKNPTPILSPAADSSWLKGTADEKFAQIEKHFRGLDVTMAEIGYRYGELHHAAKERNWEYAKYQTEKIDLSLRLALERRPKRAASSQAFLNEDLPAVDRAIKSQNSAQMNRAMEQLHNSCIACHRSENVLHFRSAVERIRNNARR